jgi:hypothetical protein
MEVAWSVCSNFAAVWFKNELNSEFWGRVIYLIISGNNAMTTSTKILITNNLSIL